MNVCILLSICPKQMIDGLKALLNMFSFKGLALKEALWLDLLSFSPFLHLYANFLPKLFYKVIKETWFMSMHIISWCFSFSCLLRIVWVSGWTNIMSNALLFVWNVFYFSPSGLKVFHSFLSSFPLGNQESCCLLTILCFMVYPLFWDCS